MDLCDVFVTGSVMEVSWGMQLSLLAYLLGPIVERKIDSIIVFWIVDEAIVRNHMSKKAEIGEAVQEIYLTDYWNEHIFVSSHN